MKIGIAVTTRNRREVAEKSIREIRRLAPKGSKVVVVDDASDIPFRGATYRFPFQAGIARAKNKCLELLDDCDYLFLFDDDCYPIDKDWHLPYINSGLNHASFNFVNNIDGMRIIETLPNGVVSWSSPRGCMMFFTKKCLQVAGGMNEQMAIWGYEHPEYSRRVWEMKLNPVPFPDLECSLKLFYSYDRENKVKSTVPDRMNLIEFNREIYMKSEGNARYYPYKANRIPLKPVILACYLNGARDPQRGIHWGGNVSELRTLIESCQSIGVPLIVLHDCLDWIKDMDGVRFQRVPKNPHKSPLSYRWLVFRDYLEKNHHSQFFCVDATDVKLLKNPFAYMERNRLYVGDEWDNSWQNVWVEKYNEPHIKLRDYGVVKRANIDKPLLNCGIVGGDYDLAYHLISMMADTILKEPNDPEIHTDMGLINYFARKYFADEVRSGFPVNTRFKEYEEVSGAWFKHK